MLSNINNLSLVISFLASLTIYFRKEGYENLRPFPIFLLAVSIAQWIGKVLSDRQIHNTVLYNLVMVVEFLFYLFILSQTVKHRSAKRIVRVLLYIFAVLALINLLFLQGIKMFNSMTYALGSLLTVAVCIYYFYELFQSAQPSNVARIPVFWICCGLLFFYALTFPLLGLLNFLNTAPTVILQNFKSILDLLNIFLYSSFTIAFLCRIKVRNSMS